MKLRYKLIRSVVFVLILLLSVQLLNDTMVMKRIDGITPMKAYYDQKQDTVDVLIVGSSRAGMNLSTKTLWDQYGIASFVLWGSVQPFWNSYYNLVEAFKSQSPKVVVLEAYAATLDFEYSDEARQAVNVEGMKFSLNKLNAILTSSPKERWVDMISIFPLVHDRYDELTADDFKYYPWSDHVEDKGSIEMNYDKAVGLIPEDATGITEVAELHEKEEKYLRMIIDLCRDKGVPLVLLSTPTVSRSLEQPYYNRVAEIAEETNTPYINCNLLDESLRLDWATDFYSDGGHINFKGSRKVTRLLGNYLKQHYELPDRRGQKGYESWDISSYEKELQYILRITDVRDYFAELSDKKYLYYIIKNSSWESTEEYQVLSEQLAALGIGPEVTQTAGGTWTLNRAAGETAPVARFDGNMLNECSASGAEFSTDFRGDGTGEVKVNGKVVYHLRGPGIILVIFDPNTQKCIDVTDYLVSSGFALTRP